MAIGIVGRKVGMTRVFTETGSSLPVTVIQVEPNRVTQVRTAERDGYCAVQVAVGSQLPSRVNKPSSGHLAKAGVEPGRGVWEIRLEAADLSNLAPGSEISVSVLEGVEKVDVTGTTIGKGFAGTIKRHNFRGQRNTHGNSLSHRVPGSIGQNQTPGRVFKGKKMAGHMGNVRRTTQNLRVVRVDAERHLLLVMGAVPGPKGGNLIVRPAVKARA
jgi:large subunit ribosomal protein L3